MDENTKTTEQIVAEEIQKQLGSLKNTEKVFSNPEETKEVNYTERFNKAIRDLATSKINAIKIDRAFNSELSDGSGAYLTPMAYAANLVETINQYGFARNEAQYVTMNRDKMRIPLVSSNVTAYNPAEGAAGTTSNLTFTVADLDATKYMTIVPVTNELLADSAYDLQGAILRSTAIAFANKEDSLFITELGDCTLAVSAAPGVAVSTSLSGSSGYGKLIDVIATLEGSNTNYIKGAKWLVSPSFKAAVRKIVDTTGQPILQSAQGAQPEMLLGYPVVTSNLVTAASSTGGAGAANVAFFGNFKDAMVFGDRQSFDLYVAREGMASASDNLFTQDMSAFRVTERVDVENTRTDAVVKFVVASA